jgi:hypothetical protein
LHTALFCCLGGDEAASPSVVGGAGGGDEADTISVVGGVGGGDEAAASSAANSVVGDGGGGDEASTSSASYSFGNHCLVVFFLGFLFLHMNKEISNLINVKLQI